MFRSRILSSLFVLFGLFALATGITLRVISDRATQEQAAQQNEQRLRDVIAFVDSLVESRTTEELTEVKQTLRMLGERTNTRILLLDETGQIHGEESAPDSERLSAGLEKAKAAGEARFKRETDSGPEWIHIHRADPEQDIYARIEVPLPATVSHHNWSLYFVTVSILLLGLIALLVPRVRLIHDVTASARKMADGEFNQPRLDDSGAHDIAELATAFNAMNEKVVREFKTMNRAQSDLKSIADGLSIVLGSMVEGVVAVDHRERVLFANPAAIGVFDTPTDSYLGRPVRELFRNPTLHELITSALAGTGQQIECTLSRAQKEMAIVAAPLAGTHKSGVVLVMHDVTELRRLERVRRDFVSNASHELKTPLSVIQACADTLMDGTIDDPDHNRRFVKRIQDQSERLRALILDMLQLSRVENVRETFDMQPVSIHEVLKRCEEGHETVAVAKTLTFEVTYPSEPLAVLGSHEALDTMLTNLIENAMRYTPEGGEVRVVCAREHDHAIIHVSDNGPGIPSEHLTRIFERFYRVDHARARELGGTGLGLAIVKNLATVLQGSVTCNSTEGEGTTFTIRLPVCADVQAQV